MQEDDWLDSKEREQEVPSRPAERDAAAGKAARTRKNGPSAPPPAAEAAEPAAPRPPPAATAAPLAALRAAPAAKVAATRRDDSAETVPRRRHIITAVAAAAPPAPRSEDGNDARAVAAERPAWPRAGGRTVGSGSTSGRDGNAGGGRRRSEVDRRLDLLASGRDRRLRLDCLPDFLRLFNMCDLSPPNGDDDGRPPVRPLPSHSPHRTFSAVPPLASTPSSSRVLEH